MLSVSVFDYKLCNFHPFCIPQFSFSEKPLSTTSFTMDHSKWRTTNTLNPMAQQTAPRTPFPPIFPKTTIKPMPPMAPMGSLYGTQSNTSHMTTRKKMQSMGQWAVDHFITQNFIGFPLYTQSAITLLVGLVAYCLWGSSSTTRSMKWYLVYKVLVLTLVLLMGYLLSLMFGHKPSPSINSKFGSIGGSIGSLNRIPPSPVPPSISGFGAQSSFGAKSSFGAQYAFGGQSAFGAQPRAASNPYLSSRAPSGSLGGISEDVPFRKESSLFFTEKKLTDRGPSAAAAATRTDSKYDFKSSPTKTAAINPAHIADRKTLSSFLQKQQDHRPPRHRQCMGTPIGKTFAMTPNAMSFQSPAKSMNQS